MMALYLEIMILKQRLTHNFAEIKVDEIETTLFKSDKKDVEQMIYNLLDVVDDLAKLIGKDFSSSMEDAE
jgi:hypothetical protein